MNKGRTFNSVKNVYFGVLNKFILLILSFVSRKIFIEYIGIEYLGINGLFSNILQFLSLADLGFGTAMAYTFYKPIAENDYKKINSLVQFYSHIYNLIALAVLLIGLSLLPFLNYIINIPNNIDNIYIYYVLFLLNTVVSYLFVYKSTLLNANQSNYILNRIGIIINFIQVILQILSMIVYQSYFIYIFITIIGTIVNNLCISKVANKKFYLKKCNEHSLSCDEKRGIYSNLKSVFIYKFSGTLLNGVDNILISIILGTIMVGYYANYQTIIINLNQIVAILFTSITASIGNYIVLEKSKGSLKLFNSIQFISNWIATIITIGIIILSSEFIEIWLGKKYVLDCFTVYAIGINLYFSITAQPLLAFREATGLYRQTKYIMLVAAFLNLIISIPLAYTMGLSGIILGTVIARLCTYFWYEPHILYTQFFEYRVTSYYITYIKNIILTIFLLIIFKYSFSFFLTNNYINLVFKSLIIIIATSFVYFILYRKKNEFKFISNKFRSLKK